MSQTQMLLLTLVVVIAGVAVVIGIAAFSRYGAQSNYDALLYEALRISGMAQQWKSTPEIYSGSPNQTKSSSADFQGVTFKKLGLSSVVGHPYCYENVEGQFGMQPEENGLWIFGASQPHGNRVVLHVTGLGSSSIDSFGGLSGDFLVVKARDPVYVYGHRKMDVGPLAVCE